MQPSRPALRLETLHVPDRSRQVVGKTHRHIHAFMQNAHHAEIAVIEFLEKDIVMLVAADEGPASHRQELQSVPGASSKWLFLA